MAISTEASTPLEKFLSGALAIIVGLVSAIIANKILGSGPDTRLTVSLIGGVGAMVGYLVGLYTAKLVVLIIVIVFTAAGYYFRNELFRTIYSFFTNG